MLARRELNAINADQITWFTSQVCRTQVLNLADIMQFPICVQVGAQAINWSRVKLAMGLAGVAKRQLTPFFEQPDANLLGFMP